MMRSTVRLFWVPVAIALLHCGSQQEPVPLAPTAAQRTTVPAGRMFHVRLLERLSTRTSHAGEAFRAATVATVQAADGERMVPAGATVRGHVVAVNPRTSTMRIKFDAIETVRGFQTLHATLAPIQQDPGLEAASFTGPGTGYDTAIGPVPPNLALESPEGTPRSEVGSPLPREEPLEIALEADSGIRLMLTAPLGVGR